MIELLNRRYNVVETPPDPAAARTAKAAAKAAAKGGLGRMTAAEVFDINSLLCPAVARSVGRLVANLESQVDVTEGGSTNTSRFVAMLGLDSEGDSEGEEGYNAYDRGYNKGYTFSPDDSPLTLGGSASQSGSTSTTS